MNQTAELIETSVWQFGNSTSLNKFLEWQL